MAEFKDVVEKTNRICHEHIYCGGDCPLYKFNMFCPTDTMNEVDKFEYAIMNYELERKEE